jgi:hypothetical protein
MEDRNTLLSSSTIVDLSQMHEYLRALVNNKALRETMGANAQRIVKQRFDWAIVVREYESLFAELAATGSQQGYEERCGCFSYDVQKMFSHYPTLSLDRQTTVRVSSLGRQWLEGHFEPHVPSATMEQLLRELSDTPQGINVSKLLEAMGQRIPSIAACWIVGRMLKYGVFTLECSSPVGLEQGESHLEIATV